MDAERFHQPGMLDRYVAGELPSEEQTLFEQHLFDCPACFEEVQWAESFRTSLRTAAAEDVATASLGLSGWLARHLGGRGARRALWAAVALAALLPWAFLVRRQARLDEALAARAPVAAERDRLAGELARERQAHRELAGRLAQATAPPQLARPTLLLPLGLVRERAAAPQEIHLDRRPAWLVLSLEPPGGPTACRVTVLNDEGRTLWRAERVEPSLYDTLLVTLPSDLLPPGRYRVRLEALSPGHPGATEIPFRVLPPA